MIESKLGYAELCSCSAMKKEKEKETKMKNGCESERKSEQKRGPEEHEDLLVQREADAAVNSPERRWRRRRGATLTIRKLKATRYFVPAA